MRQKRYINNSLLLLLFGKSRNEIVGLACELKKAPKSFKWYFYELLFFMNILTYYHQIDQTRKQFKHHFKSVAGPKIVFFIKRALVK